MSADIQSQRRAYQKGLVLGLTTTEIMMLALFVLLLALAAILVRREDQSRDLGHRLAQAEAAAEAGERREAGLESMLAALNEGGRSRRIDEMARELVRLREAEPRLRQEVTALKAELERLDEDARELKALRELVEPAAGPEGLDPETIRAALRARHLQADDAELARQLDAVMQASGTTSPAETMHRVGEMRGTYARAVQAGVAPGEETAFLNGLIEAQQRQQAGPSGTERPSCWIDAAGRPEYIFDLELTSTGIIVRDRAPAHRAASQAGLPLAPLRLDVELRDREFLDQTRGLLRWTQDPAHACRFFIRVQDRTGPGEKQRFKEGIRTIEQRFYKLLRS